MGVDFVLDYGCPVKEQLSTDGMVRLIKNRTRATAVLKMARQDGNNKSPSEILITEKLYAPNGVSEERHTSVQSLLDAAAPLDGLAHHCEDCSARIALKPFPCYGSIRYPIQSRTEQWLLSLLPANLDCTAGLLLQKCIKDFGYDGGAITKLRDHRTFFEDPKGDRRAWKSKGFLARFSAAFSVTSSQLLQMMFCVGPLQPSHCSMLCLFLGLIPHDTPPEAVGDPKTFLRVAFKGVDLPDDVPDLDGLLHFSDALLRSVVLGVPVIVDY